MGKNEVRRRVLFQTLATNLSFFTGSTSVVLCPICLREFETAALESGDLTLEHVVPGALGGRDRTLTCRQCNNVSGSAIESHVVAMMRSEDGLDGNRLLKARMRVKGIAVGVAVQFAFGRAKPSMINVVAGQSDPEALKALQAQRLGCGDEINLSLSLGYMTVRVEAGLLRMAYLRLFAAFGYGAILHPWAQPVRDQILGAATTSPASRGVFAPFESLPPADRLIVVREPPELRGFLVTLKLYAGACTLGTAAFLPPPNDHGREFYERLAARRVGRVADHISGTLVVVHPSYLNQPALACLASRLWGPEP